jgi:hypothetical protein
VDLVATLQELSNLNVGFVSLTEALDLTTSTGRAMAGMLSVLLPSSTISSANVYVPAWSTPGSVVSAWGDRPRQPARL